jgi:platelet-activating factor acetylhydrolase
MPSFLNKDAPKEVIDAALEKANIDQPRAPEVHKHSAFGSLISRQLPAYSGPYDVGVCDVEAPVEPRMVGTFLNKSAEPGSKPGFRLDTVLYTLFYPSEKPHIGSKNIVWFPRLRQTIDGFLEMADRTSWLYRSLACEKRAFPFPFPVARFHPT